jgi:pimeloyl-ACP methyl ester carboxylesterase
MGWRPVSAESPLLPSADARAIKPLPNAPLATLGGTQFWTDELVFHGWRIQRNVLTDHCRLLDDRDIRRAWGSFEQCETKLDAAKQKLRLPPLERRVVLTLHGIIRSRDYMAGIGGYLEEEGGYEWLNMSYASTRGTLDEHAASLARVIEHLDGVGEINFVAHSLGNLVVRRYLGEAKAPAPRWKVDPRIRRVVMLAPPNQGAQLASFFDDNKLICMIWGPCCKQLAREWDELEPRLGTPRDFGIIAGGRSNEKGANPLVEGDDDFVVSVEETRLAGARDFAVVKRLHGQLVNDPSVREYVLRYLDEGYFVSEKDRQPILETPLETAARP